MMNPLQHLLGPMMQGQLGDRDALSTMVDVLVHQLQSLREENEHLKDRLSDWMGDAIEPVVGDYYCLEDGFRSRFDPPISFRALAMKLGDPCIALRYEGTRSDKRLSEHPVHIFRTPFDEDPEFLADASAKNPFCKLQEGPLEQVLCSHDLHRVRTLEDHYHINFDDQDEPTYYQDYPVVEDIAGANGSGARFHVHGLGDPTLRPRWRVLLRQCDPDPDDVMTMRLESTDDDEHDDEYENEDDECDRPEEIPNERRR